MPLMIDTIEDRLRYKIGDLIFQVEVLQQRLDEASKYIADLEAKVETKKTGKIYDGHEE